jgi:hypothetical protein
MRGRRATAAWLRARLQRVQGDAAGASASLERELAAVWGDGTKPLTAFAVPFITAAEWRLARGDALVADSLARLGLRTARVDSLTLTRSGLVGRAELMHARALARSGNVASARDAVGRAVVALSHGYGEQHPWTRSARTFADSPSR